MGNNINETYKLMSSETGISKFIETNENTS